MMTAKKIAILDTSVLLHDANSIFGFDGYDIIIPFVALNEVDKFRSLDNEVGRNARGFIRSLNKLRGTGGKLAEGVQRKDSGEKLFVKVTNYTSASEKDELDFKLNDDKILALCLELIAYREDDYKLVTKDISLMAKANVIGIPCEDYCADAQVSDLGSLFTGTLEVKVPGSLVDKFYQQQELDISDYGRSPLSGMIPDYNNTCITLIDEVNSSHTALAIYSGGKLRPFKYDGAAVSSVSPLNREQLFAFELLMDPDIPLVTITGPAGTGKTLAAIACGIHQTMHTSRYDRLLVSRPVQPLGKDIGFLPGDISEKMDPWMSPIRDAVEFVFGGDTAKYGEMRSFKWLEIEPLTYIRGRSLPRTLFILDEAQNLTRHEMKTIISRIGKDSKLVLTGDVFQIDNHYLDTITNGLTSVVEKFKPYAVAGHVTLTKGHRSKLATLAAEIL